MRKLFFISTALFFGMPNYAQVGINTENPHTALDVNGSIQLRKELRVNGNPGEPGEIYFSKGNIDEPEWKEVNVPFLEEGQYQLINTYAVSDETGIDFTGATTTQTVVFNETFDQNSPTRSSWTLNDYTNGSINWVWSQESGNGGNPNNDHTNSGGNSNRRNASFSNSSDNGFSTRLVSPTINLSGISNPQLSFYYAQNQRLGTFDFSCFCFPTYQNELKVYYRTSSSGSWQQLNHYTGNISSWTNVTLTLPNPTSTYQIAFEGINHSGYANVIDDVQVYYFPVNSNSYNPSLSALGESIIAKNWTRIPGLDLPITIGNGDNKISVVFQTGVESRMNTGGGNQTAGNIKYTCGLFQRQASQPESSATLVAVRGNQINNTVNKPNADKSQSVFTLTYTVDDTPAGDYIYSVACRRLSLTGGGGSETTSLLSIGNSVNSGNNVTNDFMLGSILKMDIIELVTVTGL